MTVYGDGKPAEFPHPWFHNFFKALMRYFQIDDGIDCAREKCRTNVNLECDGYGNYKDAVFTMRQYQSGDEKATVTKIPTLTSPRTGYEAALPTAGYL
ncbi:unnamed protein product [Pieris brassicae]|uniref:Uncharacterized protein n=1 Tax=Pieris brassicae TaxID=7116 RepID=A0A9P0T702_PIEBR|nr:unnamed protein product [Pieris brassicae]